MRNWFERNLEKHFSSHFRVFVAGLKSYGKIVYVFSVLPIFGMTLLCAKLLGFLPNTSKSHNFFPETDWSEFFLNSKVIFNS